MTTYYTEMESGQLAASHTYSLMALMLYTTTWRPSASQFSSHLLIISLQNICMKLPKNVIPKICISEVPTGELRPALYFGFNSLSPFEYVSISLTSCVYICVYLCMYMYACFHLYECIRNELVCMITCVCALECGDQTQILRIFICCFSITFFCHRCLTEPGAH